MAIRVISSVVGLPFLIGFVLLGGIYLKLGLILLSIIAMHEFYHAVDKKNLPQHFIGYLAAIFQISMMESLHVRYFKFLVIIFVLALLIYQVIKNSKVNINNTSTTLFGFFYIALMFSNIYLVRHSYLGIYTVWLIFICAWCCDTGAYFVGINFGKHKLAPVLSPKKSIEGSIGGVVITAFCAGIYGFVVSKYINDLPEGFNLTLICAVIGIFGSIFAQFGDLAASSIKRYTGVKDFGKIMPGHGGILDRFDSVIFTSAIVYLLTNFYFKNLGH